MTGEGDDVPGAEKGSARRSRRALIAAVAALAAVAGAAAAREKLPPAASAIPADLFGAGAVAHPPAADFAKWTDTMARYARERRQEQAACAAGDCALVRWRAFLETLRGAAPLHQLAAVNAYINRAAYRSDQDNYGVEDYWATPRELFARGGDCEDYAIAKYLSLRALGWPAERLRVAVVRDTARDLVHAALIAYHGGTGYVLDIEIPEVTDHRKIARYAPIFAIGESGWWSYDALPPAEGAAPVAQRAERAAPRISAVPAPPRSPHLRHPLGRPAKRAVRAEAHAHAWRSPHLKHAPRRPAKAHPSFAAVLRAATDPAHAPPAPAPRAPEAVAEPGERLEELFLPGAR